MYRGNLNSEVAIVLFYLFVALKNLRFQIPKILSASINQSHFCSEEDARRLVMLSRLISRIAPRLERIPS